MAIKKYRLSTDKDENGKTIKSYKFVGDAGDDRVLGSAGDDHLEGGLGRDFLKGGAGYDVFVFKDALGNGNVDTIADLNTKIGEKIMLDHEIFTGIQTSRPREVELDYSGRGPMKAASFCIGKVAKDADDRIVYDRATGAVSFDADGNGAGSAVQFAQLKAGQALTASDFFMF